MEKAVIEFALEQPAYGQVQVANELRKRAISGYGKTPMQTFIESAKLAYDRQLDRIQPTSEPAEEVM